MIGEVFKGNHPTRPDWFCCRRCRTQHVDCPMLTHELWATIRQLCPMGNAERDLLCTNCVEELLGRQLVVSDLLNCLGNSFAFLLDERHAAMAERQAAGVLLQTPANDMDILARLARACYRSPTESAAIANIRTVLAGILEE